MFWVRLDCILASTSLSYSPLNGLSLWGQPFSHKRGFIVREQKDNKTTCSTSAGDLILYIIWALSCPLYWILKLALNLSQLMVNTYKKRDTCSTLWCWCSSCVCGDSYKEDITAQSHVWVISGLHRPLSSKNFVRLGVVSVVYKCSDVVNLWT